MHTATAPVLKKNRPESGIIGKCPESVLLLGTGWPAQRLQKGFRELGLNCRTLADPEPFLREPGPGVRLVLVVPPMANLSAEDFCLRLRQTAKRKIPVFLIGGMAERAGRLKRAGASGQFVLPREEPALIRTVLRLAGPLSERWKDRSPRDVALKARVEDRLRAAHCRISTEVQVRVRRGIVRLAGVVPSKRKISELGRSLTSMPGVDTVVTADVRERS